jgi:hypothetical protein
VSLAVGQMEPQAVGQPGQVEEPLVQVMGWQVLVAEEQLVAGQQALESVRRMEEPPESVRLVQVLKATLRQYWRVLPE